MKSIQIPFEEKVINGLLNEAKNPKAMLVLAHGAGAGMNHSFMETLTNELNKLEVSVLRFNFPYIDQGRKSPGSPKANIYAWHQVVDWTSQETDLPIFLSGKSYGGRMASHLLAAHSFEPVKGIIYFGFPLHAPGKDSKDRANHLPDISIPQLFLQGTKDALARIDMINEVASDLPKAKLVELQDADHSFKTKGKKIEEVIKELAQLASNWMQTIKP